MKIIKRLLLALLLSILVLLVFSGMLSFLDPKVSVGILCTFPVMFLIIYCTLFLSQKLDQGKDRPPSLEDSSNDKEEIK